MVHKILLPYRCDFKKLLEPLKTHMHGLSFSHAIYFPPPPFKWLTPRAGACWQRHVTHISRLHCSLHPLLWPVSPSGQARVSKQAEPSSPLSWPRWLDKLRQIKRTRGKRDIHIPIFNLAEDQEHHEFWRTVKLKNGNEITIQMRAMDFNVNDSSFKFL